MNNLMYLTLPIKSLNSVVKFHLQQNEAEFSSEAVGCKFKGSYFDFKVTKSLSSHSLCEESASISNDIHVNQIDVDQPIILCVLFLSTIKCFILDEVFFSKYAHSLSFQHKGNYYQLHTQYKTIVENCACVITIA